MKTLGFLFLLSLSAAIQLREEVLTLADDSEKKEMEHKLDMINQETAEEDKAEREVIQGNRERKDEYQLEEKKQEMQNTHKMILEIEQLQKEMQLNKKTRDFETAQSQLNDEQKALQNTKQQEMLKIRFRELEQRRLMKKADDEDEDEEEEMRKKLEEQRIRAEQEQRKIEMDKIKGERDEDRKKRQALQGEKDKLEEELEKSKTIFINSYDNQKKFIDSTEKHSQLLINQLGLMSQQIVDSEDRREEESRRKEELEIRKDFERRIKDQMDRSMDLQMRASEKIHGIEQMRTQVNALIDTLKLTVQRNKNLEGRVLSLESIINAERARRQITESNKPNMQETEEHCNAKQSCQSCTKDPQCGWCQSEMICKGGDPIGPHQQSCVYWDYDTCSQSICQSSTRCKVCVVNQECGWCEATKTCSEGSKVKPLISCPFGYLHQDMKTPCDPDAKDIYV